MSFKKENSQTAFYLFNLLLLLLLYFVFCSFHFIQASGKLVSWIWSFRFWDWIQQNDKNEKEEEQRNQSEKGKNEKVISSHWLFTIYFLPHWLLFITVLYDFSFMICIVWISLLLKIEEHTQHKCDSRIINTPTSIYILFLWHKTKKKK